MNAKLICALTIASLAVMSCHHQEKEMTSTADITLMEPDQKTQELQKLFEPPQHQQALDSSPVISKLTANIDWNKKIIKNATVKLEVKSGKKFNEQLQDNIKKYGAYIAQEDNVFNEYQSESLVVIKVPVAQFEGLMNTMNGEDIKVMARNIKSEDVTGQVVDTKSRLEAKKQMRLKYLDFLKQSKNMEEVLQVQKEINDLQEEIEAASGRIGYLNNQSAFSTINLSYYEPTPGITQPDTNPGFATKAIDAFKTGADIIKALILGLITIWPLVLIIFVAVWIWKRSTSVKIVSIKA